MYQRQPRADHKRSGRRPLWNLSATGASRPVPSRQETAIIAPLPRQGPYPRAAARMTKALMSRVEGEFYRTGRLAVL